MSSDLGKVAVLLGGCSAEREVSLMSGSAVLEALRRAGVDAHPFDPAERDLFELKREGFDRAFIALHGRGGEDGTLQGVLEWLRIPYTGSGVLASALAMDKWRTKLLWQQLGLPTPVALRLTEEEFAAGSEEAARRVLEALTLPVFVKPVHEGSSMGATRVEREEELTSALEAARRFDGEVLVERFVAGREITIGFLGEQTLPAIEIVAPQGRYDYHNKYFSDETRYLCPAPLPEPLASRLAELTMRAARALGCRGWGRIDLLLEDDAPYLLEMNTAPGMTAHSLVPLAARASGIEFDALCLRILEEARCDGPA
ncbi:D-alanine--D-alanine ligase [Tepidiphilus baoligensis]|uniref:D-alanine--D-alanine ligase n=1 Tax=Tepidiphilus baoligensis TaxID=2698687 RepID=A0ABX1QMC6_9PROT|nr:D-alanine--D-alanine ligase [Tepidiphilus baoligensis]NMH16374.1 D-alanine--D-alanine ligase [Tepidiphilus baoligensis]